MKLITVVAFCLFFSAVSADISHKCTDKQFKELDDILAKIIGFGNSQRWFPKDAVEAKKFCTQTKKDIARLDQLGKSCFDGTVKNFVTIFLYSFGASMKTYCNTRNKRKFTDFLVMSNCAVKPDSKKIIKAALGEFTDLLQRGKRAQPRRERIGHACCNYFKLMDRVEKELTPVCKEKDVETLIDFLKNMVNSLIDVACGDYTEHSNTCSKLGASPKRIKEKEYGSFILPLIELFDHLDKD